MLVIISGNNEYSVSDLFFLTTQKQVTLPTPSFPTPYKSGSDEIK